MHDIAPWLPALLLPLFCLIYSIAARHEMYIPFPKGVLKKLQDQHSVFLAMLCVIIIAAALSIAESLGRTAYYGKGTLNMIHIASMVSRIVLFCLFALYVLALQKAERKVSVVLIVVAAIGVLVRAIWAAPVDLFFVSISAFGCMVMMEREADIYENGMGGRFGTVHIIAVAQIFFLVVIINAALILNLTRTQSDEIGRIQLDIIRSDPQDTISSAEAKLLHTAISAEKLIDEDAARDSVEQYILDQQVDPLAGGSKPSACSGGGNGRKRQSGQVSVLITDEP